MNTNCLLAFQYYFTSDGVFPSFKSGNIICENEILNNMQIGEMFNFNYGWLMQISLLFPFFKIKQICVITTCSCIDAMEVWWPQRVM